MLPLCCPIVVPPVGIGQSRVRIEVEILFRVLGVKYVTHLNSTLDLGLNREKCRVIFAKSPDQFGAGRAWASLLGRSHPRAGPVCGRRAWAARPVAVRLVGPLAPCAGPTLRRPTWAGLVPPVLGQPLRAQLLPRGLWGCWAS